MAKQLNTVIVGSKPIDNYVLAAIVLFNQGAEYIILKGRGPNISRAVDVYNALKRRLGDAIELSNVEIGSEQSSGGRTSFIKVTLKRLI